MYKRFDVFMNLCLFINYFQCGKKKLDFINIYNYITVCDIKKFDNKGMILLLFIVCVFFFLKIKLKQVKKNVFFGVKSYIKSKM